MTVTMNSERTESTMAYADVIETNIGSCRRWQVMVFLIVFLVNMPLAMQELIITIIAPPTKYNCSDPAYKPCAAECPSHVYDKSIFTNTIIIEWSLICDSEWLQSMSQTILMSGILVGNCVFGFFADRYGRRKPLLVAIVMEIVTGIAITFCYQLWLFFVLRFLVAVAAGGTLCTGFVIVVEVIGRKYRATFGILFQMPYYVGNALLGLIGYFIRDWRYVQLTISLPVICLLCYFWLLPESPRWLLSVGRIEEAIIVMEKAAKFNKMPTENIRNNVLTRFENVVHPNESICDLFSYRNVLMKTILIWLNWIILGLTFFGVAQYIGRIGGNLFVNVSMTGLIQIPGNVLLIYTIQKWGRKVSVCSTYLISGIALLLITVVPAQPVWVETVLGCIGMMGISLAFATMFVWSGELYATPVRNIGMGTSATCAKIGSLVAPFVVYLQRYQCWLPPAVFGIAPICAVLVSLLLPETINTKMPDSMEEAEEFTRKSVNRQHPGPL